MLESKYMILSSITTTSGFDWKEKIKEVKSLGLKEVCFFLTCLDLKQRKTFYKLVKETKIKEVPLAHLRSDMELWELDYLVENYNVQVFNIHSPSEFPLLYDYSKYKDIIYLENIFNPLNEEELKEFAGICLDIAHLENDRLLNKEKFKHNIRIIEKYFVGCNHISCIGDETRKCDEGYNRYDRHFMENLSDFDYLKRYPKKYFSSFMALEIENSIKDQLKAIEYISTIIF